MPVPLRMLSRMWFPFNGWAAKVQMLVTRLQFVAGQANDEAAAAAMARESDAQEYGARVDREADRPPHPMSQPSTSIERSASDG